jgi:hypothetical protein
MFRASSGLGRLELRLDALRLAGDHPDLSAGGEVGPCSRRCPGNGKASAPHEDFEISKTARHDLE